MDRLTILKNALRDGLIIEPNDSGWEFYSEDGETVASCEVFEDCIDMISGAYAEFDDVEVGREFEYLGQRWEKTSYSEAVRGEDQLRWSFPGDERVSISS